ncbi:M23 family metallopeptidase [Nonlabens sp. YIK11]|uniref:M23 family metallopeptidase n=1 Tax=Nonlabens sp. YIK11 TaxID=1453349 RepID=UPI0006DC75D7|nr:M23 family metallopeptidase [Nonlabens sp. YIK11]
MRFLLVLFILSFFTVDAQELDVTSGAVAIDDGYAYLVTNNEPYPITVKLDLKPNNLKANTSKRVFVVPAHSENFEILQLHMIKRDTYGYKASASYLIGNQTQEPQDFLYHLPYARTASYRVSQGNNSSSTHRGKYAIDFSMPTGTPVHAARGGLVIAVREDQSLGCTKPKCLEYANYIKILHEDGTIAEYTHLMVNGSLVRKGDKVNKDQHIGYSGNTGWSTGPHLHFTVYRPEFSGQNRTIPVRFWLGNSVAAYELQENRHYRKP